MKDRFRRGSAAALGGLMGLVFLTSCNLADLSFRVDRRVHITSPQQRSTVTLPLTVSWTVTDFQVTGPSGSTDRHSGYFAVFFDQTPIPPSESLRWLSRDDNVCLRDPGCPDSAWLNQREIFTTSDTSLTVTNLPDTRPLSQPDVRDAHTLTVVFLSGQGVRLGESAFTVDFFVARP